MSCLHTITGWISHKIPTDIIPTSTSLKQNQFKGPPGHSGLAMVVYLKKMRQKSQNLGNENISNILITLLFVCVATTKQCNLPYCYIFLLHLTATFI